MVDGKIWVEYNRYKEVNNVQTPKWIFFDYGQTLVDEVVFDSRAGADAMFDHIVDNPYNVTKQEFFETTMKLNFDTARYVGEPAMQNPIEISDTAFNTMLFSYYDLTFDCDRETLAHIFWDAAAPGKPTPHIDALLAYLRGMQIHTGVISNTAFDEKTMRARLSRLFPEHQFEQIICSSNYAIRKPSHWIFDVAARKAHTENQNIWYCGDDPYFDIMGAAEAGMQAVWYKGSLHYPQKPPKNPCIILEDWRELIALIQATK